MPWHAGADPDRAGRLRHLDCPEIENRWPDWRKPAAVVIGGSDAPSIHRFAVQCQHDGGEKPPMQDETPQTARDVAGRLDLKRSGRGWRGDCPACGYAGTFSVREGQGGRALYWCASCQDRDGLSRAIGGGTVAKLPPIDRAGEAEAKARKQDRALALWNNAVPIEGTRVALYLTRRGLPSLIGSPVLRYRRMTSHPASGESYSAMIALVADAAGNPLAIHRTYIASDGRKADVVPTKASLGPIWGGAIRLSPHDPDKPLVIGEGIETAASAGILFGFPAWSAVSCGNLGKGCPATIKMVMRDNQDGKVVAGLAA